MFAKIDEPVELKDNNLINMGETFMVISLLPSSEAPAQDLAFVPAEPALRLKIFGGPSAGESYVFRHAKQEIVVGRSPNCDVRIDDSMLSKTQATITHDDARNCWILEEGYGGKSSTNGTWLYIKEEIDVTDGMQLKANQTIFKCVVISP